MVQGFKSCQIVDERFDSCFTVFSCLGPSLRWFELGNDGFWSLDLLVSWSWWLFVSASWKSSG